VLIGHHHYEGYFLHVNQAANSTQKKTLRRGFVMTAASPPGFPVRIVPGALGQSQGVASLDV